jgi:hypothetical protein
MEIILGIATLLGGISAVWYFSDKLRERRRTVPTQLASERSAPLTDPNPAAVTVAPTSTQQNIPFQIPDEVPYEGAILNGPITPEQALPIDVVLQTIESESGTSLQKAQFVKRHSGRHVIWTAELKNIQPSYTRDPDSDLIMVIAPVADREHFPQLATAVFPAFEGDALGALDPGDVVAIEGDLSFLDLAGRWSVSLKNAHFIRCVNREHAQRKRQPSPSC